MSLSARQQAGQQQQVLDVTSADRAAGCGLTQVAAFDQAFGVTCVGWAVGCGVGVRPRVAATVSRMLVGAFVGAVGGAVGCAVG